MTALCEICGIEMKKATISINPYLCEWCETHYEREYERDGSYGLVTNIN